MSPPRFLRRALHAAALLCALCIVGPAAADQYAYLDLPQAHAALARLKKGDVVHLFCAPCGEPRSERMTVRELGIDRIWKARGSAEPYRDGDTSFWAVRVNSETLDLAYVYVRDGRRWRNLADLLGLAPGNVPIILEPHRTGTRWRCGEATDNPYWTIMERRRDPCPVDAAKLEAEARADPDWR